MNDPLKDSKNGFSVILAHCGMSPGDVRLHEVLNNPFIYADTSTLHGKDVPLLFNMAKDRITANDAFWSEKLLFGTDYSFLSVQAIDVILHLLSRDFPGTLADVEKVLGGNALQLVQKPIRTQYHSQYSPKRIIVKDHTSDIGFTVLDMILSSPWELASLDYMIPPKGSWPHLKNLNLGGHNGVYFDSYLATLISYNENKQAQIWVQKYPDNYLSCSVLNSSSLLSLDTCELATQRMDSKMLEELGKREQVVKSKKQLISTLREILRK
jgi:hypothetical protein